MVNTMQAIIDAVQKNNLKEIQQLIDIYPGNAKRSMLLDISVEEVRRRFINMQDEDGNTLLQYTVLEKKLSILKYLVSLDDINVNIINKLDETPLTIAVKNNDLEAVRTLFTTDDLKVNLRDNDAKTPLLRAASDGSIGLCNLLFEHLPTKIYLRDKNGKSALDYLFERKLLDSLSDASITRIKISYPNFLEKTPESWIHSPDEKNGKLIAIFQLPTDFQLPPGTVVSSSDVSNIGSAICKLFTPPPV